MTYLTILEKLQILFTLLLKYKVVLAVSILLIIVTLLYIFKMLNKNKYIILTTISIIAMFAFSIISNYEILSNTFDNFMTVFFTGIYFPSIYVYIGILVINLIAFITSIFNKMLSKTYKLLNTINFILSNIILVIILNIIAQNKIDIFSVNSLYTNKSLVAILEISTSLFLIWIGSIIVTYVTNIICFKLSKKEVVRENIIENKVEEVLEEINNKEEVLLPKNNNEEAMVPNNTYSLVEEAKEELKNEVITEDISDKELTINDILGSIVPVECENNIEKEEYIISNPEEIYESKYRNKESLQDIANIVIEENAINKEIEENNIIVKEENKNTCFTLEDYKKISKMLKDIRNYTTNGTLSVDDAINLTLISNYSIDDCLKFKDILESSLN